MSLLYILSISFLVPPAYRLPSKQPAILAYLVRQQPYNAPQNKKLLHLFTRKAT